MPNVRLFPACFLLLASCAAEAGTPEATLVQDSSDITLVESVVDVWHALRCLRGESGRGSQTSSR